MHHPLRDPGILSCHRSGVAVPAGRRLSFSGGAGDDDDEEEASYSLSSRSGIPGERTSGPHAGAGIFPREEWRMQTGGGEEEEEEGEREREGDYINEMAMRAGVSNLSKDYKCLASSSSKATWNARDFQRRSSEQH